MQQGDNLFINCKDSNNKKHGSSKRNISREAFSDFLNEISAKSSNAETLINDETENALAQLLGLYIKEGNDLYEKDPNKQDIFERKYYVEDIFVRQSKKPKKQNFIEPNVTENEPQHSADQYKMLDNDCIYDIKQKELVLYNCSEEGIFSIEILRNDDGTLNVHYTSCVIGFTDEPGNQCFKGGDDTYSVENNSADLLNKLSGKSTEKEPQINQKTKDNLVMALALTLSEYGVYTKDPTQQDIFEREYYTQDIFARQSEESKQQIESNVTGNEPQHSANHIETVTGGNDLSAGLHHQDVLVETSEHQLKRKEYTCCENELNKYIYKILIKGEDGGSYDIRCCLSEKNIYK